MRSYQLCQLRVVALHAGEQEGEGLHGLAHRATLFQLVGSNSELVQHIDLLLRNRHIPAFCTKQVIGEVADEVAALFGEYGGHVLCRLPELVPAALEGPLIDGATANADLLSDLCLSEAGL